MRRLFGVTVLACLLSPGIARAQSDSLSVQRQIQPLLDDMMVAANAHDTDRFLASYLHQPSLVFVYDGVVTNGFANVRALQLQAWNNGKSDVVYKNAGALEFTILGPDAAVVTEPLESHRTLPTGVTSTTAFAVTEIWQKRPEGWRVVQVHESTVRNAMHR